MSPWLPDTLYNALKQDSTTSANRFSYCQWLQEHDAKSGLEAEAYRTLHTRNGIQGMLKYTRALQEREQQDQGCQGSPTLNIFHICLGEITPGAPTAAGVWGRLASVFNVTRSPPSPGVHYQKHRTSSMTMNRSHLRQLAEDILLTFGTFSAMKLRPYPGGPVRRISWHERSQMSGDQDLPCWYLGS